LIYSQYVTLAAVKETRTKTMRWVINNIWNNKKTKYHFLLLDWIIWQNFY